MRVAAGTPDLSDRRAPERQREPKAGVARTKGAIRRTNGFHTVPGADARGFHRAIERDLRRRRSFEGRVVKGKIVAIEKDMAVIDVGLKTEGRVALKEFTNHGRDPAPGLGDEVEVYLERIENALGEAVISRDKARREESWVKLEQAFEKNEKVEGVIFNQVKGGFTVDLDGAVAFLPRSQVDVRRFATSGRS